MRTQLVLPYGRGGETWQLFSQMGGVLKHYVHMVWPVRNMS